MNDLPYDPSGPDPLDRLLDLDRQLPVPRDLAARVLAGLERSETRALDALLELDPEPAAPADLAARVIAAVRAEERARRRFRWLPGGTLPRVAAAAAVILVAFGGYRLASRASLPSEDHVAVADAPPELLELLPVLERWELLEEGALGSEVESADIETLALFGGEDELLMLLALEENG